jgi:hypothetical protein
LAISGQPDEIFVWLVLTDTAGPEELLRVKASIELGAGSSHCYGGQSARGGIGDVTDVFSDEFEISAAHEILLVVYCKSIITRGSFLVNPMVSEY